MTESEPEPDEYLLTNEQWLAVRPLFIDDEGDEPAEDEQ